MKKYLLLLSVCCSQYASCIYDLESLQSSYVGWYAGAGLSYQRTLGDILISDNANSGVGPNLRNANDLNINRTRVKKLGGSLITGYGTFLNFGCYLGTEVTLDFAKNNNTNKDLSTLTQLQQYNVFGPTSVKTKGSVPTLAIRLGGYSPLLSSMFYVKFGGSVLNNKFEADVIYKQGFSNKQITPILGIGIERNFASNLNVRFEIDYRFSLEKKKSNLRPYLLINGTPTPAAQRFPNYKIRTTNKSKGYSLRLATVYHF